MNTADIVVGESALRLQPLDTAGVRLRTLLNPDPAADLQTMVLVANR